MQVERNVCSKFATKTINLVEDIPNEEIICPFVQETLNKIIKNENYMEYNIFSKTFFPNNDNYMGSLVEIDVKGKTVDGDKETYIFVKHIVPEEGIAKGVMDIEQGYKNEVFVYSKLQDIFNELYEEAGVPEQKRFRIVKSYECNDHVVILENLSRRGFISLPKLAVTPIDYARDSMKQLAKFHALSFVLEFKKLEFFEKTIKTIKTPIQIERDEWRIFVKTMVEQCFEHHVNKPVNVKKEELIEELFEKIPLYFAGRTTSVKCMCHGDFKSNNILFRRTADEEIETVLIDYQLLNYGTPMLDIFYFLYMGTDRAFRKDHLEDLKEVYYEALTEALNNFDLDVNNIYPRSLFMKDFDDCREIGMICSFTILAFVMTEDPEYFKNNMTGDIPKINDTFTERLNGVLEECIEWGIL